MHYRTEKIVNTLNLAAGNILDVWTICNFYLKHASFILTKGTSKLTFFKRQVTKIISTRNFILTYLVRRLNNSYLKFHIRSNASGNYLNSMFKGQ